MQPPAVPAPRVPPAFAPQLRSGEIWPRESRENFARFPRLTLERLRRSCCFFFLARRRARSLLVSPTMSSSFASTVLIHKSVIPPLIQDAPLKRHPRFLSVELPGSKLNPKARRHLLSRSRARETYQSNGDGPQGFGLHVPVRLVRGELFVDRAPQTLRVLRHLIVLGVEHHFGSGFLRRVVTGVAGATASGVASEPTGFSSAGLLQP